MWDGKIGSFVELLGFVVECMSGLDLDLCVIRRAWAWGGYELHKSVPGNIAMYGYQGLEFTVH